MNHSGRHPTPPAEPKASILLVDDTPANLVALRAILEDLGPILVEVRSGEEAIAQLMAVEFAVVLLDVRMPGLNGFETAQVIRADVRLRHTPIIFLTADDIERPELEQGYALGAVDFLAKPLIPVILRAKVTGFVELFDKTQKIRHQAQQLRVLERQRFDSSVRELQEWFRVTLSSIGDAVVTTDTQGRVTFLNPVAQELTGWTHAEAQGKPLGMVFRIVNEQTRKPVENPVEKVLREGMIVGLANHTVLVAKNGSERPIDDSAAPIRSEAGEIIGVVLIFRDVTEQRRAEREIRQSEARKSAIVETALDCIVTMDHEGKVVEFNPAAEKTFGYRRADVIGKELADFIIPPSLRERHHRGLAHYLATGEGPVLGRRLELPALHADGTEFPIELAITRIPTDGPALFTAYMRDLSEQQQAEQRRNARLAVTHALSEAAGIEDGVGGVLQAFCENLGWDAGIFWRVDESGTALAFLEGWHRPEVAVQDFVTTSSLRTFVKGEGLPGRVWASGKEAWIVDVVQDGNFPRHAAAAKGDLHSALACPVVVGDRALGVIEFFTKRLREPDTDLLEMLATVAGNVGQFLERKTAEEQVRQSERELADFFENAIIGLHWVGVDGNILRANRADFALLGYSREEYVGRPIADFHADEDVICDILQRLQAGENLAEYPARLRCKDGAIKEVLIDSSVMFRDGKFVHTRCFTRDVTERKRAERELHDQQKRTHTILESITDAFCSLDRDWRFVYINQQAEALLGRSRGDLLGKNHWEEFPDTRGTDIERNYRRAVAEQVAVEFEFFSPPDDRWYELHAYPSPDGLSVYFRDVSQRRRAEESLLDAHRQLEDRVAERTAELARGNEFLETLLENVQTGVVACDAAGVLTLFNGVTRALHGLPEESMPPDQWAARYRLYRPDGRTLMPKDEVPLYRALQGERVQDAEMVIATPGVPPRTVLTSGQAFYDDQGNKLGAVVSMQDITARKHAEDALQQSHDELERRVEERTGELARANAALQESEEKLRLMADTIPQLAWMARPDGHIFWYNRRWYEYTGTAPEEMEGWGWQSVHHPDVLPKVLDRWKASIDSGKPFDMVFPLKGADGQFRPFLTRVNPLTNEGGQILYWFGTNTDVTELREAREALADSEERLRLALDAGHMGVWDWNVRTGGLKWSDSLEPLHGIVPGTFRGTFDHFQELIHPEDRVAVNAAIRHALDAAGEFYVEFRNVWRNGDVHWIAGSGKVFPGDDGQPIRMIGIGLDVTRRKRAEQTARFLADASAALAELVDFDSTLQKLSSLAVPTFADWATVDLAEADGSLRRVGVSHVDPAKVQLAHEVHRRFPPDPAALQGVWNILRTGRSEIVSDITDELLVQSVEGEELLGIMRQLGLRSYIGVPLTVRGKTLAVITFINAESGHRYDHTDLAVAEDLASRAAIAIDNAQLYRELRDADQQKDEFLATLAHELRNPLAPIRNGLQVLRLSGGRGGMADEARSMMERQLSQMVRLVDDLLDMSRITRNNLELRKERVSLAAVVNSAVETSRPLMEQVGHRFSRSLPDVPVYLDADLTRLAQVFSNLLNNAAKYTEPGGHISLTADLSGADEVVVEVRDNGLGIPADALPRIFEMFSQVDRNMERAQGGLGIGLTLVRRLVELHGGTVEARSDGPGRGSQFVVRLPVARATRPAETSPIDDGLSETVKRRILVVDDNHDAAKSMGLMLDLMGNETHTVHDGLAAIQAAEEFRPDLILLDIGLPKLNGYDACRRIRQQPWANGMVIVALTGWGQDEDRRRSQEAGFDHHLVKPVDIADINRVLAEAKP